MEKISRRSLATLNDTERIGIDVVGNLALQKEQLDRIERNYDEIGGNSSSKHRPHQKSSGASIQPTSGQSTRGASIQPPNAAFHPQPSALSQYPSTGSKVVDENLEEMSRVLDGLASLGTDMGAALDNSGDQLARVRNKMESAEQMQKAKVQRDLKNL